MHLLLAILSVVNLQVKTRLNYVTVIKHPGEVIAIACGDPNAFAVQKVEGEESSILVKPLLAQDTRANLFVSTPYEDFMIALTVVTANHDEYVDLRTYVQLDSLDLPTDTQKKKKKAEEDLWESQKAKFAGLDAPQFMPSARKSGISFACEHAEVSGDWVFLHGTIKNLRNLQIEINDLQVKALSYKRSFLFWTRKTRESVLMGKKDVPPHLPPHGKADFFLAVPSFGIDPDATIRLTLTIQTKIRINLDFPLVDIL